MDTTPLILHLMSYTGRRSLPVLIHTVEVAFEERTGDFNPLKMSLKYAAFRLRSLPISRKFSEIQQEYLARVRLHGEEPVQTERFKNSLLRALDAHVIQRLALRPIQFELKHEIEYPGSSIDHLYFVEDGMASMTTTFDDGSQVEVGMFGYESVIGVSALMGTKKSLNRVYTQIAGHGYSCPVETARKEFGLGGEFHKLALRYVQAQLLQAMQSAGCNARHNFEQRLARWLLICADRAHTNTFKISHEFLADMLGGGRPTVTTTAGILKEKGLIEYSRGKIQILDVPGLRKTACECYSVIKRYLDDYTEFDTGITA